MTTYQPHSQDQPTELHDASRHTSKHNGTAAHANKQTPSRGIASLNRDSLETRMDRAEDARLPHTERQSRIARPSSALP
eukprot:scaffold19060_cov62-Phaeocystis_antarctica.AAC.1